MSVVQYLKNLIPEKTDGIRDSIIAAIIVGIAAYTYKQLKKISYKPNKDFPILIVDDEYWDFELKKTLNKHGWNNVIEVSDITSLEQDIVKQAKLIFLDIQGVGKTLTKEEGRGLLKLIKAKYREKFVIIYSVVGQFLGDDLKIADGLLLKSANQADFLAKVEECEKKGKSSAGA